MSRAREDSRRDLGNDVNLRDVGDDSALLIGKARTTTRAAIGQFTAFRCGLPLEDVSRSRASLNVEATTASSSKGGATGPDQPRPEDIRRQTS